MGCVSAALVREFAISSDPVSVSWARLGVVADASPSRGARGAWKVTTRQIVTRCLGGVGAALRPGSTGATGQETTHQLLQP